MHTPKQINVQLAIGDFDAVVHIERRSLATNLLVNLNNIGHLSFNIKLSRSAVVIFWKLIPFLRGLF